MRTSVMTLVGVGLLLGLLACDSTGGGQDSTDGATGDAAAEACAEFFEGRVPLAERAEEDRAALSEGEITDDVAYAEINGLESRISSVADEAPDEIATLLEQVNAPFTEAVERVNEYEPEEGGPTVPDLQDIDVSGSQDAQSELESICEAR